MYQSVVPPEDIVVTEKTRVFNPRLTQRNGRAFIELENGSTSNERGVHAVLLETEIFWMEVSNEVDRSLGNCVARWK